MDTVTYPDSRVAEFIEHHFLPVKVTVKQEPALVKEYLISWTPNVVVADEQGKVHYRIEGYLPPEDFVAYLSLGIGKFWFNRKELTRGRERFEEVVQRHPGTDAGAEALYWLGVAQYKETHNASQLHASWQKLAREYPGSAWTRRTQVPAKG